MFANDSDLPITTRMETNSAYPESEAPPVLHPARPAHRLLVNGKCFGGAFMLYYLYACAENPVRKTTYYELFKG